MAENIDLYTSLTQVIPADAFEAEDYIKLKSPGYMDLVVEVLSLQGEVLRLSLAHYFEQNEDLVADPDCEIEVDLEARTFRPVAIQMAFGPYFRAVDHVQIGREVIQNRRSREIHEFLVLWFWNLGDQGFTYHQGPAGKTVGDHYNAITS